MVKRGATLYLLVVSLAVHCIAAQRVEDPGDTEGDQLQIINGEDANKGEFPFMVRITKQDGEHVCGGSLLSPKIVLTAGHCVLTGDGAKVPVNTPRVVVGDHTNVTEGDEQVLEWMRIILHEDYYVDPSGVLTNDLALIVLKEEAILKEGTVSTISLAEDNSLYAEGTTVTVIGWGVANDTDDWPLPETLQKLEYNIANQDKCMQYWEEDYKKNDNYGVVDYELNMDDLAEGLLCAVDPTREATAFAGDSGGPLFVKNGETFTQIGLVSWGLLDPKEKTFNVYANTFHYIDWIKSAMKRADEDSWLELHTGGSHGLVLVHNKNGRVTTICNDNVGKSEADAICREQGYKMGALASVKDYQVGGRRRKNQGAEFPPFGYTNLICKSDANSVISDCEMDKYEDSKIPCFDGQQLSVKCADENWSFKVTHMISVLKPVRSTPFVKGRVMCTVRAQKYGIDLDMNSQVQVGLVIRHQDGLDEIDTNMKYKKKMKTYITRLRRADEMKADETCFACIAFIPRTKFYTVAKLGSADCPDNNSHYEKWVEDRRRE